MSRQITVPRDAELLIEVVGLLEQAKPEDRLPLARVWRSDAVRAGEGLMLPEPAALVWLARHLEESLAATSQHLPTHSSQAAA